MGRSRRVIYECDGCGSIGVGKTEWQVPAGFRGGEVQVIRDDGESSHYPAWWACSPQCLRAMSGSWVKDLMANESENAQ